MVQRVANVCREASAYESAVALSLPPRRGPLATAAKRVPSSTQARRGHITSERARVSRAFAKRAFDILFSLAALIALSPVYLIIAVLVRLDGGPAFFIDQRPGRDGRLFGCIKFRTMHIDAAERLELLLASDPVIRAAFERSAKLPDDPRVTVLGRFLRRSSLDELPQFVNCLLGHMSVVGPRPRTRREMAWARTYGVPFDAYFAVRPGLTGPWQIAGRSALPYAERVAIDAQYADHWSMLSDLVIVAQTIPAVVSQRGAT